MFNRRMGGLAPPDDSWKGGLKVPYNVGPGFIGNFSAQLRDYFYCNPLQGEETFFQKAILEDD